MENLQGSINLGVINPRPDNYANEEISLEEPVWVTIVILT